LDVTEVRDLMFYRCQWLGSNIVRPVSVLQNTLENALVCLVLSNVAVFEDTAYVLHTPLPEVQSFRSPYHAERVYLRLGSVWI
jgi:hypothetical protein